MPEYTASTWDEFEGILDQVKAYNNKSLMPLLYRGHRDASWNLQTTLQRRGHEKCTVEKYYRLILRLKPDIELFSGLSWDSARIEKIFDLVAEYDKFSVAFGGLGREIPGDGYMAYLRHYGFPSPLLDWSMSPYIAAYFAFSELGPEERAVYVLAERPHNIKGRASNEPQIYSLHGLLRPHRRHYFQQSKYTICAQFDFDGGWSFVPYKKIEDLRIRSLDDWRKLNQTSWNQNEQDVIFKIRMGSEMRAGLLNRLDMFNLNAFSLFGSEESLMETLAFREIDAKESLR